MSESNLRAFTARFEPEIYEELRMIAELQNRSMNRIVVEAVAGRLRQSRQLLVKRYEDTLDRLKSFSDQDSDFEQAIEAFVAAEVSGENPAEGRVRSHSNHDEVRLDKILTSG